jgi:5-methylcytosine-specific restriction endonuclease McrA
MKIGCSYCGRIHEDNYICKDKEQELKRKRNSYKVKDVYKFYKTKDWKSKREDIMERDMCMCQLCIRDRYMKDGMRRFEYDDISVHHILKLNENYDKRLDEDNLISFCKYHHSMVEDDRKYIDELIEIAKEQNEMYEKRFI